jgi:hypothetical protein
VNQLDFWKKESKDAREATRFILEKLKFQTAYLRVQGTGENVDVEDPVVGCVVWFKRTFLGRRIELVTDDVELGIRAREEGVVALGMNQAK